MSRKVKNGVAKEGAVAKAMCGSAAVSSSSEGSSANRGRSRESPSKNGSCISEEEEREQSPDIDAKGKKAKQRLTMDQINYLEMSFQADHTKAALEPCRKMAIAKHLDLHPRQVAIWFQNRRARWKNKQLETDYDALKAKYDASLHHNRKLQAEVARLSALLKSSDAGDVVEDERKCKRVKVEADSNFVSPFPLNPSSPLLYEEVPKGASDNEGEGSVISFALAPSTATTTTTTTTTSTTISGPLCNDFSSKTEDCLQGELVGDLLTTSSAPTSTNSAPTSTIVPIGTGSVPIGTTTTMTSCMHFVPYYPDEEHHCNFILGWEDQEASLAHPTIWEEWQGFYPWLD